MFATYQRNGLAAAKRYDRKNLAQTMLQVLMNLNRKTQ